MGKMGLLGLKSMVILAKTPGLLKVMTVATTSLLTFLAFIAADAPVNNPWFDAFAITWILIGVGAIIAGEPEPDVVRMVVDGRMKPVEFFYLWFFRSTHIVAQTATAYFIHPNKWHDISGARQVRKEDSHE